MRLARTIRFDESDSRVFDLAAEPGEWAVSGGFAFSDWREDDLTGRARQTFANGWLGLQSFGRATFVAVTEITEVEYAAQIDQLAQHFVEAWGAPDLDAARPFAAEELGFMRSMCDDHAPNTLLVVERKLIETGVSESFRVIPSQEAKLEAFAVHGSLDDEPNG
ncbi:MAG: DUF6505 family protein [Pikeienuella sp.]